MKTVNDIRSEFLEFFASKGHERVASSSLVPQNDPTLMFTNSGMVQFKNVFTGVEKRDYSRATTAQKSVRAGGKHNDLENVGYTARHHTFFEMLGNFSFGDYFKEDAIAFAWELITQNFGMPTDKLLITVHSSDEEAADIWKRVSGFSDSKIIRIPTNDNFWMMGDTGPCGPCSEIFYDQGDALEGGPPGSPNEDGDRFLEFWNLVFMQYEQEPDGEGGHNRTPLPKPSIDTGMGLERMAALMQGKLSNYDIDLLRAIIEHCSDLTGIAPDGDQAASHRVIADHLRCSAFLMADGVMPSNEGRGYVLRRIMRRGMRHAHLLGAKDPVLYQLYPTLLSMMGQAYPELKRAEPLIVETLKNEETRFKRTLDNGLKILEEESGKLSESDQFPGDVAFKLYDTYGFPVDLTQDALRAKNIDVDIEEFESCMARQREQARKNWSGSGDTATEKLWFDLLEDTGATEFLGYVDDKAEGQILAIVKDGKTVEKVEKGDQVGIIVNQTPFYAESGGQVGDQGTFTTEKAAAKIQDVQKHVGKLFVHEAVVESGTFNVEDSVVMEINVERRNATRANHSATHLLHEALHQIVGDHVTQKGSLVNAERLRFDISQPAPLTEEQIAKVEQSVNEEIRANTEVITRILPLDEAMESGAMAMFGEKYDDEVRVLFMGKENEKLGRHFSIELCGGTHVRRTGDIGLFKVTSEGALSSGIRRVEAVTGLGALQYLGKQEQRLQEAADILKTGKADVVDRVRALSEDKKKLEQEIADLRRKLVTGGGGQSANDEVKTIGDIRLIAKILQDFPPKELKSMADDLKQKIGSGIVVLVATGDDKASIVVAVTQDLEKTYSAVDLVKAGAKALGGKGGGGRPDMAQAGGPDTAHANDAVSAIEQILEG